MRKGGQPELSGRAGSLGGPGLAGEAGRARGPGLAGGPGRAGGLGLVGEQGRAGGLGLAGKRCLLTGATSGIGLATALEFARQGANLIIVARDRARGEEALAAVRAAALEGGGIGGASGKAAGGGGRDGGGGDPNSDGRGAAGGGLSDGGDRLGDGGAASTLELADLSSMRECDALARRVAAGGGLDVLVNCAGLFATRHVSSHEGIERQFAVNHLASFVLTGGLLSSLEASGDGRVIVVSSDSHRPGRIHWADPGMGRFYFGLVAYEQSKLANVLFVKELARRLGPGSAITVFALDPGLVDTAMGNKAGPSPSSLVWSLRRRAGTPPEVPAAAIAQLASEPALRGRSGLYWKDGREVEPSRRAKDPDGAQRLWKLSASLVARALGEG